MQLELITPCRVPERGTQRYEILMYLQAGGRLTVAKALRELGVYALSQRVGELKRSGWPIKSRTVETNGGAKVSEYFMDFSGTERLKDVSVPRPRQEASADEGNYAQTLGEVTC